MTTALKDDVAHRLELAISAGVKTANREYDKISGGEWISDRGVESLVSYHVSKSIIKKKCFGDACEIKIDASMSEITDSYLQGKRPVGRPSPNTGNRNRIDITVTDRNQNALCCIEIKRSKNIKLWPKDIKRMKDIINRHKGTSKLKYTCFVAFCAERKGQYEYINTRIEQIKQAMGQNLKKNVSFRPFEEKPKRWIDYGEWGEWRFGIVGGIYKRSGI